jgi:hypothetical protein
MHVLVIICASCLAAVRVIWLGDFLRCCLAAGGAESKLLPRLRQASRRARTITTARLEASDDDSGAHGLFLNLSDRQFDTSLIGGSVALAAWTQLFVSSSAGPAAALSDITLAVLFGGALVLLSFPLLFRASGLHLTYIGRETGSAVGFGLIVLSLCSAMIDLGDVFASSLGTVLCILVVLRDAFETRQQVALNRYLPSSS